MVILVLAFTLAPVDMRFKTSGLTTEELRHMDTQRSECERKIGFDLVCGTISADAGGSGDAHVGRGRGCCRAEASGADESDRDSGLDQSDQAQLAGQFQQRD